MSKKRIPWRKGRNSPAIPKAINSHPVARIATRFQSGEFIENLADRPGLLSAFIQPNRC
jgi:hypothetical protein